MSIGYAAFNTVLNITAKANIKKQQTITAEDLKALAITSGDGLYADTYEDGRYMYRGANPDNYITFNNETWRIISVEVDNTIKIVRNLNEEELAWDEAGNGDWGTPVSLNTYLNSTYLNTITTNKDKIKTDAVWSVGKVIYNNTDMTRQVRKEKEITWTGSIALPTASEYLRTNSNVEQCGTYGDNNTNALSCKATTWMYGLVPPDGFLWTVSANQYTSGVVTVIYANSSHDGEIRDYNLTSKGSAYAPTLYLVSDVTLSGSGTSDNPYIIK